MHFGQASSSEERSTQKIIKFDSIGKNGLTTGIIAYIKHLKEKKKK